MDESIIKKEKKEHKIWGIIITLFLTLIPILLIYSNSQNKTYSGMLTDIVSEKKSIPGIIYDEYLDQIYLQVGEEKFAIGQTAHKYTADKGYVPDKQEIFTDEIYKMDGKTTKKVDFKDFVNDLSIDSTKLNIHYLNGSEEKIITKIEYTVDETALSNKKKEIDDYKEESKTLINLVSKRTEGDKGIATYSYKIPNYIENELYGIAINKNKNEYGSEYHLISVDVLTKVDGKLYVVSGDISDPNKTSVDESYLKKYSYIVDSSKSKEGIFEITFDTISIMDNLEGEVPSTFKMAIEHISGRNETNPYPKESNLKLIQQLVK